MQYTRISRISAEDVDVDARLSEVPGVLFGIASCLFLHHFLVLLPVVFVELIERCICGRVRVDILMYKVDNPLYEVCHAGFALPVLSFEHGHADIPAFIDMDVLEILLKGDLRAYFWVLRWESDRNGIDSALPERVGCAWNPKDPFGVAGKSLRHAFHDLSEGQLSDLLEFVLYSALPHAAVLSLAEVIIRFIRINSIQPL